MNSGLSKKKRRQRANSLFVVLKRFTATTDRSRDVTSNWSLPGIDG